MPCVWCASAASQAAAVRAGVVAAEVTEDSDGGGYEGGHGQPRVGRGDRRTADPVRGHRRDWRARALLSPVLFAAAIPSWPVDDWLCYQLT